MKQKQRARALIRKEDTILLIKRYKNQEHYHVLPGGGKEGNETLEEAVMRECREELSVDVAIMDSSDAVIHNNESTTVFRCEITSDNEPRFGAGPEQSTAQNQYSLAWVTIAEIDDVSIKPTEIIPTIKKLL